MLKYAPYSFSRINTWLSCPRKFRLSYIDKIGKFEASLPLDRGSFIHCLLEHDLDIQKVKKTSDMKEILSHNIMTKDDFKECIQITKEFKDSKIGKFLDSCTHIHNELPIAMNKKLKIVDFKSPEVIFRGYIDLVVRQDDTLILVDYKSGRYKPDMQWDQLLYYGLAMFDMMPFDKIVLMNAFVEHNKMNKTVLHRKDLLKYQKALFTNIANIEKDEVFEKHETPLCNWCSFQDICEKEK